MDEEELVQAVRRLLQDIEVVSLINELRGQLDRIVAALERIERALAQISHR